MAEWPLRTARSASTDLMCEDDAPLDGEFGFVSEDRIGSGRSQFARSTFPPPLQPIKLLVQLGSPQHIVIDDTSKQAVDCLISPPRFGFVLAMVAARRGHPDTVTVSGVLG